MSFKIFQNEKTPFQAIKTRSSKSGKIHIFPKWLTDGFRQKMPLRLEKCLLRYSKTKRRLSRIIKKRSSKSRKIHIFLKGLTHGFGPKMALFPTFFLGKKGQENVFYNILERNNAFVGYKNKKIKSRKIDFFQNGLTYGFSPKMAIFQTFFLANISPENVFYDILHRKNAFLGNKNKKFKKSKN